MNRFIKFFKESRDLGLSKKIICIAIILFLGSVFFEAVGLSLIFPIISIFFTGEAFQNLIGNQTTIKSVIDFISSLGISVNKLNLILLLSTVIILRQFLIFFRATWSALMIAELIYKLRQRAFGNFLLSKEDLFNKKSSGNTVNDMSIEVNQAAAIMIKGIDLIGIITMFIVYISIMFYLSISLTLLTISSFVMTTYLLKGLWSKSAIVGGQITSNNRLFMSHVTQRFSNLRLLKLTGDVVYEKKFMDKITEEQRQKQFKAGYLVALTNSCIEPFIFILASLILYGAIEIFGQTLLDVGLFSLILIRGVPLARSGFAAWQAIEGKWASLRAIKKTIDDLASNKENFSGSHMFNTNATSVVFNKVSYRYNNEEKYVINAISFEINAGEIIALVGPSGAGKSTLIDLIPRLKIPESGEILINNININTLKLNDLRKNIAFLPQTPQILDGSIKDHIMFGNSEINDKDIWSSLKKAGCEGLVKNMNKGIDTQIGNNGVLLSGGERQRIDLARVLARNSSILILDEPSSNLDVLTENIINSAILEEQKQYNKTIIQIGHRLRSFKIFNKIIVLNNGMIEAIGSHDEVIKNSDWYSEAWLLSEK